MKNQHPLVQVLVRAVWIYLGALIFLFVITKPQGYTFTSDPIRGYLGCVIVSTIVQAFKKPNQAQPNQDKTAYQVKNNYPKYKSQEQIKAEKLKERRAAYDRDLTNRMRAKGMSQAPPQKNTDSAKYKKLLAMLGGDRATADRLIDAFGIDRAISDLERDRRIN